MSGWPPSWSPTEPIDVEECRRWFSEQGVARFKTPELVVHVDAIPLLGLGKPDRSELRSGQLLWAVGTDADAGPVR